MPESRDRSISPSHPWPAGPNDNSNQGAPDQQEPAAHSLLSVAFNDPNVSHTPTSTLHSTDHKHHQPSSLESIPEPTPRPTRSKPIAIPKPGAQFSLSAFDPDRVPSNIPLTARGSRKDFYHYYPYPRSPSPPHRRNRAVSDSYRDHSLISSSYKFEARHRRRNSTSSTHLLMFTMHNDQYAGRYTPTSPLSPQIPSSGQPITHQSAKRSAHARQTSRSMHMPLPRFHPMAYPHHGQAASPSSVVQSPAIAVSGVHSAQSMESPRLMRQKHREFLDTAKAMSVQAASPASNKPTSPRLDPLGSPKGAVTPLALEEGGDYFTVRGAGKPSPATSPGSKSIRSEASSGREELAKNKRKVDVYH